MRPTFSTGRCARSSSLAKFTLFVLLTGAYCYLSYLSMPSRVTSTPSHRATSRANRTTKTIIHHTTEQAYDWTEVEMKLSERKDRLQNICTSGVVPDLKPNAWEFVIDAKHELIWCNIFKAASSSWMYNFNLLGGYPDAYLRMVKKNPITLLRARFPRPTVHQLETSLPSSLSFLIVRDPFHRLLSAYRDKLETVHSPYYRQLAKVIVARYRAKSSRYKGGPTFAEFASYVADSRKRPDEHWAPFYKFCTPCAVNFTVIAKLETLNRDQNYIIHRQKLERILTPNRLQVQNRSQGGLHTKDLIKKYYSKLSRALLDRLVDIYRIDFQLFDYNAQKYYDLIKP
ncbi:carbohydrate sulfotransferase 10 isoform X2 [Nilaparvata lugens]|uniref:carbohydrate sulfotransferase 10 isoform X1 n=1 Tax=Nilaparvata lugens TaxID=108931 RepID=UPI00193E6D15|nr:carbohydrate sulfotransferase 10 isoform X1 [Nilaparvata lugens]XP_039293474.1 carbohydrate sulfotransferase 10 isoform X2 [Nilaparvata lugens]